MATMHGRKKAGMNDVAISLMTAAEEEEIDGSWFSARGERA
jgi:hypothetical protein